MLAQLCMCLSDRLNISMQEQEIKSQTAKVQLDWTTGIVDNKHPLCSSSSNNFFNHNPVLWMHYLEYQNTKMQIW